MTKELFSKEPSSAHHGFAYGVTRSHYAAGSLVSFTFSEFLEGLILVALHLQPPPSTEAALTGADVMHAVASLLTERVLKHANHGDVLEFRRMLLGSSTLSEGLAAIRPSLETIYAKYGVSASGAGAGSGGDGAARQVSLQRFVAMCKDANLVGGQLSSHACKLYVAPSA